MSTEPNNDAFKAGVLEEIKDIIEELHKLKNIKRNIIKKSTKRNPARKSKAKRKTTRRR